MEFRSLTIEDRKNIERFSQGKLGWENSFACVWAWNVKSEHKICVADNFTILHNKYGLGRVFSAPYCNDDDSFIQAVRVIEDYCAEFNHEFKIVNLSKRQAQLLSDERFIVATNRNSYDYIYNTSDLINLEGKKYHSKRNFIRRFADKYNYEFRDYREGDLDEVVELLNKWLAGRDEGIIRMECAALLRTVEFSDQNDIKFGVLTVDEKIVGFSIGQVVDGVGHTLFEKADVNYDGVYQTLNNLFAKTYYSNTKYINRQEDMGVEGLRKAKLSYHPTILLEKYNVSYRENKFAKT